MRDMVPFRRRTSLTPMDIFRDFFGRDLVDDFFASSAAPMEMARGFCADIREEENEYIVEAELPGYNKEDINIDLVNDRLTISAKKKEEHSEEKDNYIRRERRVGQVCRSFIVSGIENDKVSAKYENGLLHVTLPKEKEIKPKSTRIDIN
ncbi:MAG: Hsp20/alpha crystallin family protein [Clostridiales bacterium]|nr:Hsp20/alpha crystallin family protein [Clostridiales bacterium]